MSDRQPPLPRGARVMSSDDDLATVPFGSDDDPGEHTLLRLVAGVDLHLVVRYRPSPARAAAELYDSDGNYIATMADAEDFATLAAAIPTIAETARNLHQKGRV